MQMPSDFGEQRATGLLLVKRQADRPKHIAVALTGYISVCSVTSYHACNGGNCLHCHNISSAGASWPGTLQQLWQGTSPHSPGACSRPTHRRSPSARRAPAAHMQRHPRRLRACRALGAGSLLPALALLPELSTAHGVVPKGLPAPEVAITADTPAVAWDGPMNRSL